jgi:ATP-dependent RNA helicase HelY
VTLAMLKLRPGDVIYARKGRYAGRVAVLTSAHRKGGQRLTGITTRRDPVTLTVTDFDEPPRVIGHIALPEEYAPDRSDYQREVAQRLERAEVQPYRRSEPAGGESGPVTHPVEDDPELAERLKAAQQAERVAREVDELRQRVGSRGQSIARDFDRVLRVLEGWGYVATLAALASVFVYEHRSPDAPPEPWYPSPLARRRWQEIARTSYELQDIEEEAGLTVHRPPDPTFVAVAYAWAAGEGFAEVVDAEELSGGDFVRTTKQLIDLLRQLAIVAPERATRQASQQAADALFRGVVAASSALEEETTATDDPEGSDGADPEG